MRLSYGRTFIDRVDGRDVEPRPRLHKDQPRLRALLCRDLRGEIPRRTRTSVRARIRLTTRTGEALRATPVAEAENDLCEFDE